MADIQPIGPTESGTNTRAKMNEAISRVNRVDDVVAKVEETVSDLILAVGYDNRPADARVLFTSSLTGSGKEQEPIGFGQAVTNADGTALRVTSTGGDPIVVASRVDQAVEPGLTYSARVAVRRSADTSDPLGDAIQFGISCLNAAKQKVSERIFYEGSVVVADGLISRQVTFSRDQEAELKLSETTRYVRPFVRIFGGNGITDVVVVGAWEASGLPGAKGDTGDVTPAAAALREDIIIARSAAYQAASTSAADAADVRTILDALSTGQGGGGLIFETYALLAADTTPSHLTNGQMATVLATDLGSHTDPVVGGTAPNAGTYRYSTSPAGWKRVSSATLSTVPSIVSQTRAQVPLLTTRSNVYIAADEANGYYPSLNYFDGWDLSLVAVLPWLPSVLFGAGERGAFYDFADPTSMFQDRTATIPVAFDNDPVAIVCNRAVPRPNTKAARTNLIVASEDMGSPRISRGITGLIDAYNTSFPAPTTGEASWRFMETAVSNVHLFQSRVPLTAGTYNAAGKMRLIGRTKGWIGFSSTQMAKFDFATNTVISSTGGTGIIGATDANGFTEIGFDATFGSVANPNVFAGVLNDAGDTSYAGDTTKGFYLAARRVTPGAGIKPYQKVGSSNVGWIANNILSTDTDAQRPKFRKGSRNYVEFDGVANTLFADAFDLRSPTNVLTFAVAVEVNDDRICVPFSHNNSSTGASQAREILLNVPVYGALTGFFGAESKVQNGTTTPNGARIPRTEVAIFEFNSQGTTPAERLKITINGNVYPIEYFTSSANPFSEYSASSIATLAIGARAGAAFFTKMKLFAALFINRKLTDAEKQQLSQYFGLKAGIAPAPTSFAFSDTPNSFLDTHANPATPGVFTNGTPATFSRVVYTTTANWIRLSAFCSHYLPAAVPQEAELGIYIDGSYYGSFRPGGSGVQTGFAIPLPPGNKKLEIVNGTSSSATITNPPIGDRWHGTYLTKVEADAALTPAVPASLPAERWVIWGDSISVGASDDPPTKFAWTLLMRQYLRAGDPLSTSFSLGSEGHSTRTLFEDTSTPALRDAFVARLIAWNPTKLYIAGLGTNDYRFDTYSAAAYQTAMADVIDRFHAALPNVPIFIQTMNDRLDRIGANNFGNTMDDYRTALSNIAAARPSFTKLINGVPLLPNANLNTDKIHPTNAGNVYYWDTLRPILQGLGALA